MNAHPLRTALLLSALAALGAPARAVIYTATLLPAPGFDESRAFAISGPNQVGQGFFAHGAIHAHLWNGTTPVDLHPAGASTSVAHGISGSTQVGKATFIGAGDHAVLWNGDSASVVDLHPAGFGGSHATAASGASQVGFGRMPVTGTHHALLWYGTAASAVDLHPADFNASKAAGVRETSQVGSAWNSESPPNDHAILWNGTAASAVDLHLASSPFSFTRATGVSGTRQVGYGYLPSTVGTHALLWNSTAASIVDLHPTGFFGSEANAISAAGQVGRGYNQDTSSHALIWNGTAESVTDLHPFLSSLGPTFFRSVATGIDDSGAIVGYAVDTNIKSYAVRWTPITEPGIPGDYNNNGAVDTADYIIWRKHNGAVVQLPNEVSGITPGQVTQHDYDAWLARIGNTAGNGAGALTATIPEPTSTLLLIAGLTPLAFRSRAAGPIATGFSQQLC